MKRYFYTSSLIPLQGLILFVCVTLFSCQKEPDMIRQGPLDDQLALLLNQVSPQKNKTYFLLPEPTDFDQIPQDPRNPITQEKVALGQLLFHETALGRHPKHLISFGTYSCASCHHAKAGFQACVPQGIGDGGAGFGKNGEARKISTAYLDTEIDVQPVRTPSTLNIAYQTNIVWNGQFGATGVNVGTEGAWTQNTPKAKNRLGFQGIETQAIAGQEVHRLDMRATAFQGNSVYKSMFQKAFNDSWANETQTVINAGLAIAAYERTQLSNRAGFQRWLRGEVSAMTDEQKQGAILFFGKANCVQCHTGPALNTMKFYALGMNDLENGSYGSTTIVQADETKVEHKGRGGFTGKTEDMYKFKVPQLYNLKDSPFYGHGSSFTSLESVVVYKNQGVPQNGNVPKSQLATEFKPLGLTSGEINQLVAFLRDGLYDPDLGRYVPRSLPSGLAFPNNDPISRIDLGF